MPSLLDVAREQGKTRDKYAERELREELLDLARRRGGYRTLTLLESMPNIDPQRIHRALTDLEAQGYLEVCEGAHEEYSYVGVLRRYMRVVYSRAIFSVDRV